MRVGSIRIRGKRLDIISYLVKELNTLRIDPRVALSYFKTNKMSDKTFSKLFCDAHCLQTFPGIVLKVTNGIVDTSFQIGSRIFKAEIDDPYTILFDFRSSFKNLEEWVMKRITRPRPIIIKKLTYCNVQEALSKGTSYQPNFYLIIQRVAKNFLFISSCMDSNGKVYIEVSSKVSAHGEGSTSMSIIDGQNITLYDGVVSKENLKEVARGTREFTHIIGPGTLSEWFVTRGVLYFVSAQRSLSNTNAFDLISDIHFKRKDFKVISSGQTCGFAKLVKNQHIADETIQNNKRFIFISRRPISHLCSLIHYAKGFLFEEGSLLCHLALLLREQRIPAATIGERIYKISNGDKVYLDTDSQTLLIESLHSPPSPRVLEKAI